MLANFGTGTLAGVARTWARNGRTESSGSVATSVAFATFLARPATTLAVRRSLACPGHHVELQDIVDLRAVAPVGCLRHVISWHILSHASPSDRGEGRPAGGRSGSEFENLMSPLGRLAPPG